MNFLTLVFEQVEARNEVVFVPVTGRQERLLIPMSDINFFPLLDLETFDETVIYNR